MIAVIGHKVPDTDAITSAIVAANLYTQLGQPATPYRLGELNGETKFVLETVGVEVPELAETLPAGTDIILVDHNARIQTIDNIDDLNVVGCIDHHTIDNMSTTEPVLVRVEPICSAGSILYKMYKEKGVEITPKMAHLMLSAVLSDSLEFRSPTTTPEDVEIARALVEISGVEDISEYAAAMFAAKSDLGDISVRNLVTLDFKEMVSESGKKIGIGVVETTDPGYSLGRKEEILEDMKKLKAEDGYDYLFLSIIDIIKEENTAFVIGDEEKEIIEKGYDVIVTDSQASLGRVVSRKKQIVPILKEQIQ